MNALGTETCFSGSILAIFVLAIGGAQVASAQFALSHNDLQLAYNLPLTLAALHADVALSHLDACEFLRPKPVLLLASAPVHLEDEIRFGQLFSPITSSIDGGFGGHSCEAPSEDFLNSQHPDELRNDASLSPRSTPEPMQPAQLTGAFQAEPLHEQSTFRNECLDPLLLANVRRFEQSPGWQIGGGGLFSYGWRNQASRFMLHCGPSFKPPREAFEGEHCFGVLFRFDFGKRKQ